MQGAKAAAAAVSGDLEDPLLVVPLAKVPFVGQPAQTSATAGTMPAATRLPTPPSAAALTFGEHPPACHLHPSTAVLRAMHGFAL